MADKVQCERCPRHAFTADLRNLGWINPGGDRWYCARCVQNHQGQGFIDRRSNEANRNNPR